MLRRDALDVLEGSATGLAPASWSSARFALRVEAARRQLAPLGSERTLLASFAREAMHARRPAARPDAVRVAYALRWLEVRLGCRLPGWPVWMAGTRPVR